ncbi:MAG: ABC transporter permease [Planctomycetes bacterium]|nr:ABC transporter permease [Planctomycetota bacterium]
MTKIFVVARHEFLTTVKRVGFLIVTFGLPLFILGVMGVSVLLQTRTMEGERERIEHSRLGVVDESGLALEPFPDEADWILYPNEREGRTRMAADGVHTLLVIPSDYLATGRVRVLTTHRPSLFSFDRKYVPASFEEYLARRILKEASPERVTRARSPVARADTWFLLPDASGPADTERPEDYLKRLLTAGFFFLLLFMSTSVSGGYLIQGVADEKENRVLEMVISSVTPGQLMTGKLIGLGAAGLLQVAIWSALGVSGVIWFVASFVINPGLFVFCALFYLLGYLLYGSLLLGIGSLGTNQRESTQYTWVLSVLTMSPVFVWFNILSEPHGTVARVFTWIPLTSPMTLMARFTVDPRGTPLWEILCVIALLAAATFLALRFAAKLYRVGLLLYGKRPTPREIWRWMWA